jgi:uncharacterized membrane protein (UPF0127 family)
VKTLALYRGTDCLVPQVLHARAWYRRLFGLLVLPRLRKGQGLLIEPCASVHTLGMRYPLDLLFLSRDGQVLGWRESVAPWRAASQRGARSTLELPAGTLAAFSLRVGEQLHWHPVPDAAPVPAADGGLQ